MLRILAAFIFFTRLPFWRLAEVPAACFKNIVSHWALVGWLTAGLSVLVLYATSLILPPSVAILCAMITRLLITGCLHEDGLADFFDGFGGGTSRERILAIMKDSHIGSYGVIGLIFYFGLFYLLVSSLPDRASGMCHTGWRSFLQRRLQHDHQSPALREERGGSQEQDRI